MFELTLCISEHAKIGDASEPLITVKRHFVTTYDPHSYEEFESETKLACNNVLELLPQLAGTLLREFRESVARSEDAKAEKAKAEKAAQAKAVTAPVAPAAKPERKP